MGGYSVTENTQSPKICLNFNFGGGGYSVTENTQSPKICLNFNFPGGGGILYYRIGVFCRICTKISTTPAGSCITDSLSHTTYMETKSFVIIESKCKFQKFCVENKTLKETAIEWIVGKNVSKLFTFLHPVSHSICIITQTRNHSFRKGLLAVILPHNNNMIKELEFTRR